ncbi:hypothetical protein [Stieleria mannarensis]|uniref:hypothetical protein n=1 Tax=Stieleria mannarensis TaxID=2755585 RepID=UPI0016008B48|nr:hypothetical protein [Rhodopirellula sp. JC639]
MTVRIVIAAFACMVSGGTLVAERPSDKMVDRVYQIIADYDLNAQAVLSQKYVCVGKGVTSLSRRGREVIIPSWYIQSVVDHRHRLDAYAEIVPSSLGVMRERWIMRLTDGKRLLYRDSPLYHHPQRIYDSQKEASENEKTELVVLEPFKQPVSGSTSLISSSFKRSTMQRFVTGEYEIESATEVGGLLKVVFLSSKGNRKAKSKLTFDAKDDSMLTEYVLSVSDLNDHGKYSPVTHNVIRWKKLGKVVVPVRYESVKPKHDPSWHALYDFVWVVGEKVPSDLLKPTLLDWREPTRQLLGIEWQRDGNISKLTNSLSEDLK